MQYLCIYTFNDGTATKELPVYSWNCQAQYIAKAKGDKTKSCSIRCAGCDQKMFPQDPSINITIGDEFLHFKCPYLILTCFPHIDIYQYKHISLYISHWHCVYIILHARSPSWQLHSRGELQHWWGSPCLRRQWDWVKSSSVVACPRKLQPQLFTPPRGVNGRGLAVFFLISSCTRWSNCILSYQTRIGYIQENKINVTWAHIPFVFANHYIYIYIWFGDWTYISHV